MRSEHSNYKEDRKFYLDICTLTPCQYGMSCSFDMINNGYNWNSTTGKILDFFKICSILLHRYRLGGVKSLVSRYIEGYSFWGI